MDLLPINIALPPKVRVLVTSRRGGVSDSPHHSLNLSLTAGDDAGAVYENRMRLNAALPAEPAWLRQAHGSRALLAEKVERDAHVGDAAYTAAPGVVCAALTADCLPVLFFAEQGEAVAAAHAGWRGLAAGILQNTVAELQKIATSPIHAIFAPAISAKHYVVGEDTRAALTQTAADDDCFLPCADAPNKWHADLRGLAARRLQDAGVTVAHDMGLCTYADEKDLFSVRRDGERTGRQAALIYIDG